MPRPAEVPAPVRRALEDGAVVALSVSGGKDSQACATAVLRYLEAEGLRNRVVAVHADLGRAEWHDTPAEVERQVAEMGLDLHVVQWHGGDLLDRMRKRLDQVGDSAPFWPSAAQRYCTSDMKRDPIDKLLRTLGPLVISVEGVRAEESRARAKKPCWEPRKRITTKTRTALTWRPIHGWLEPDVWACLGSSMEDVNRRRQLYRDGDELGALEGWSAHPAYVRGNERLSCSLCILASESDLLNGAQHNPEYFQELVQLELSSGYTFRQDTSLVELATRVP